MKFASVFFVVILLLSRLAASGQTGVAEPNDVCCVGCYTAPEFPGGSEAWQRFLQENIHYPDSAKRAGVKGTVYAGFTVDTNGTLEEFEVKKGIAGYAEFGEEVLRVLKLSPAWVPGKEGGKPVRQKMIVPVRFGEDVKTNDSCFCGVFIPEDSLGKIWEYVTYMPEFDGDMLHYFRGHLAIADSSRKMRSTAYVSFIVRADGKLVNIKPARSTDQNDPFTLAVIKAVCAMPPWKPGSFGGSGVNVRMTIPVTVCSDH